ncbi:MAG: glutamate-cysteine ligase family protein [Phycisphaerales bacterium]|jgi:CBS domain-containing protein|nr:glutamate-cysteine ligase family protein [Phycisphaerales bacterium]
MGLSDAHEAGTDEQRRNYLRALLRDVEALEIMLNEGRLESGVRRIGAEQEAAIIDPSGAPSPIAEKLLARLPESNFTTELGRFNIEMNLDPLPFDGHALRDLEHQIHANLAQVRAVAKEHGSLLVLTGILPTLTKGDLVLENLSDRPRYHQMNTALTRLRGRPIELNIAGIDELVVQHDNIMLEACNTSFQVHFQVDPEQFPNWYNLAQVATAPVLAASVNSPLLLGRRLWRETRIALFQQSIDTRMSDEGTRRFPPRVSFGTDWVRESVLEIFQEDIARFKPLFYDVPDEDPLELLRNGDVPKLNALRLFNGTVYRWNRACYGISDGKPHLRIENRVLPAGPTPIDEVANTALWLGLMRGLHDSVEDITSVISFDNVLQSFDSAARHGLDAQLHWLDGHSHPAGELITSTIIPIAREGLLASGIEVADIDRYLGVIEDRVRSGQTGASWVLKSMSDAPAEGKRGPFMARLTAGMAERQMHNAPVHTWKPLDPAEFQVDSRHVRTVGQFMATEIFTVHENDVVDLVTNLMDWKHLRHIPVEDDDHALVGLVTHRDLLHHLRRLGGRSEDEDRSVPVSDIMKREVMTVTPETPSREALRIMREHRIGSLPVVDKGKLVGIITDYDFMKIADPILDRFLAD